MKKAKKEQKLKGAEAFGIKIKIDKSLDKLSGKILSPEKDRIANEIASKLPKDFIKTLLELEKAAEIQDDASLDLNDQEIV